MVEFITGSVLKRRRRDTSWFIFSLLEEHLPDQSEDPNLRPFDDRIINAIMLLVLVVCVILFMIR